VTVRIDHLVLRGVSRRDGDAVGAALREELARVLAAPEVMQRLAAGGEQARLRIGGVHVDGGTGPRRLGVEAARGIGRDIGKGASS